MWTGILKVWEALGGTVGVLAIAVIAYTAGWLRAKLQELQDVKAGAKEDRAEFKAQLDRQRDEASARADRERDESKARSKEDRALYIRENAHLSKQIAEQSKQIAALQGDVQVLLDRSADGNVGTDRTATRYEFARQAVPAPRGEEDEEDEQP